MRILQLVQKPQRRGAEVFAHQLSSELRRRGHAVSTMYLYPWPGEQTLPLLPGDVVLGGRERHFSETLLGINPALLVRLARAVDRFGPDIIQVNGSRTVKYGAFLRMLRPWKRARVVYRNIGASADWIRGVRRKLFYRLVGRWVDGVIAISQVVMPSLRTVCPDRVRKMVVPNGVDPRVLVAERGRNEVRAELDTPEEAPVVLSVGSLSPEKRIDVLLDAFARVRGEHPGAILWVVGDGPLRAELEARAVRLGLAGGVRFAGVRTDVGTVMAAADVFALTSDTEGIPAVVLEAWHQRLPVVATRVGGIPGVVRDGETGTLVPPGDAAAVARALDALVRDPALRRRMGEAAHRHVLRHYTIEVIAEQYEVFFRSLAAPPRKGARLRSARRAA